jgi:hypothetical protein
MPSETPKKKAAMVRVLCTLPGAVLAEIDEYAVWLRKAMPGVQIGRTDAIRQLLERGLTAAKGLPQKEQAKEGGST